MPFITTTTTTNMTIKQLKVVHTANVLIKCDAATLLWGYLCDGIKSIGHARFSKELCLALEGPIGKCSSVELDKIKKIIFDFIFTNYNRRTIDNITIFDVLSLDSSELCRLFSTENMDFIVEAFPKLAAQIHKAGKPFWVLIEKVRLNSRDYYHTLLTVLRRMHDEHPIHEIFASVPATEHSVLVAQKKLPAAYEHIIKESYKLRHDIPYPSTVFVANSKLPIKMTRSEFIEAQLRKLKQKV